MRKTTNTKQLILAHATNKASEVGLKGLSIGSLASDLNLSKSGLFGHFGSKEDLQIQVLETAAKLYAKEVIQPAVKSPRGVQRLTALFENWLNWAKAHNTDRQGCIFVATSIELDDDQGPVRDKLVDLQNQWIYSLEHTILQGREAGQFHKEVQPVLAAQEVYGVMLSFHLYFRLLEDQGAEQRTRQLFDKILERLTDNTLS